MKTIKFQKSIVLNIFLVVLLLGCLTACQGNKAVKDTATAQAVLQTNEASAKQTEAARPTETPVPTATPKPPTATAIPPTETPIPPTATPIPTDTPIPSPTIDLQAAMQSAKILVFEDMAFEPYIKPALDDAGYTYTYAGDRIGTFYKELANPWDLVIAAAEGRGGVQGEFFDLLKNQLDQGASLIMETWILDKVTGGRIQPILDQCGISFQSNWVNPSNRGVFIADQNHPLVMEPNQVSLTRFVDYWEGDVGDLVQLTAGSQAEIIGSANKSNTTLDGLVTICYEGRLIMQTFSTHDHPQDDMMKMWQNYVYYALKNRILAGQE